MPILKSGGPTPSTKNLNVKISWHPFLHNKLYTKMVTLDLLFQLDHSQNGTDYSNTVNLMSSLILIQDLCRSLYPRQHIQDNFMTCISNAHIQ